MFKKIRIKKAIYNRRVFDSKLEVEYYKRYKKMKLPKNILKKTHTAVGICEGFIVSATAREEIGAWQYLIDIGAVWQLQDWYGETAKHMIESGLCKAKIIN
jgi:hypothetical protein